MKKLCKLLTYAACLSSNFAAASPVTGFDDCDRKFPLRGATNGIVAPQNTPQTGPQSEPSTELQFGEAGFLPQLFLPASAVALVKKNEDQSGASKTTQNTNEPVVAQGTESKSEPFHFPDLKIYYIERDGEETSLKRFTADVLTVDYAALSPGASIEVMFVPEVSLQNVTGTSNDHTVNKISVFDTIGWLANMRALVKWWLNPWAWWTPSRYSLDIKSDRVEWDSVTSQATIRVMTVKDVKYLTSQLRLFLLNDWSAKFAPYIAPTTQKTLELAVMLRFDKVEKPALEAIGFKDVALGVRVNLVTQRLERCIRATK